MRAQSFFFFFGLIEIVRKCPAKTLLDWARLCVETLMRLA